MPDPFIAAVDHARRALIRQTGDHVSVRELLRRAGYDESKRASIAYHLNAKRHNGTKPHSVPPELVTRLAAVLPISEAELGRTAALAAGYRVSDAPAGDGVAQDVRRYLRDNTADPGETRRTIAEILQAVADWHTEPPEPETEGNLQHER